jgi:hypothetical protein
MLTFGHIVLELPVTGNSSCEDNIFTRPQTHHPKHITVEQIRRSSQPMSFLWLTCGVRISADQQTKVHLDNFKSRNNFLTLQLTKKN